MTEKNKATTISVSDVVEDIIKSIDKEREQDIIAKRFGLYDRKETLEQIGEVLGITRERVRQLEKAVMIKLKQSMIDGKYDSLLKLQEEVIKSLHDIGMLARVTTLAERLTGDNSKTSQSQISFLAELCPKLIVIDDNDFYFKSVAINVDNTTVAKIKKQVDEAVKAMKKVGEPTGIDTLAKELKNHSVANTRALASVSKQIATLNGRWGMIKWPMVNPKNIRDKIYVVLYEHKKPMHFNEIGQKIKASSFKRKDVTVQAIHNELIKDPRFILIGRGIYALKEWGYKKGTVADAIEDVLSKAKEPLHRDEIVKLVLKKRHVKETTILLNLQSKDRFKRIAKSTYTLA